MSRCQSRGCNNRRGKCIASQKPIQLSGTGTASSLVVKNDSTVLFGMDNSSFYYTETMSGSAIRHGLQGPFVDKGTVLLEACPADWKMWNDSPEPIKTAAVLRSERESKPAGAALVQLSEGSGRYLITTIDLQTNNSKLYSAVKGIMANTGVVFTQRKTDSEATFDMFGQLVKALVCGRFQASTVDPAYNTDNVGVSSRP